MPIKAKTLPPGRWSMTQGIAKLLGHYTPWHAAWTTPQADHERYHDKTFLCVRVPDGDTLTIAIPDGTRRATSVRLLGIDAPEVRHGGPSPDYWANEATAALRGWTLSRPLRIVLPATTTRCKYRRLLAYVFTQEMPYSINAALVLHGHAYHDTRYPHPRSLVYKGLEALARDLRVGLWQNVDFHKLPRWRQRREICERGPLYRQYREQRGLALPPFKRSP